MFDFLFRKKKEESPHEPLYFHNTLSGKKELFVPLRPHEVTLYSCGPTVYDYAHIGNMRSFVFSDLIRRTLEYNKYTVRQVINITDVGHLTGEHEGDADTGEDKIEVGARREGKGVKEIVAFFSKAFFDDIAQLNIKTGGTRFPKASEYIDEQIAIVKTLAQKGYAYKTSDGLYFDTSQFKDYGELGNINVSGIKEGARIGIQKEKHTPTDFALWKFSQGKRQQEWNTPWGVGFPGWHLECTAMVFALLGKRIDIHTGGIDHIPIHHNNEIAQAEAVTGKQYVNYWIHNEFMTIEGKKISKSLGNTIRLSQLADRGINPLTFRYWLLTAHYHSPINFTWETLEGAEQALRRLHRMFVEDLGEGEGSIVPHYQKLFQKAVNDDLDTPAAIALLWELVKDEAVRDEDKRTTMLDFDRVLAIGFINGVKKLKSMLSINVVSLEGLPAAIRELVEKREEARAIKNWEEADRLREEIKEAGFTIEDTDRGPRISSQ